MTCTAARHTQDAPPSPANLRQRLFNTSTLLQFQQEQQQQIQRFEFEPRELRQSKLRQNQCHSTSTLKATRTWETKHANARMHNSAREVHTSCGQAARVARRRSMPPVSMILTAHSGRWDSENRAVATPSIVGNTANVTSTFHRVGGNGEVAKGQQAEILQRLGNGKRFVLNWRRRQRQ